MVWVESVRRWHVGWLCLLPFVLNLGLLMIKVALVLILDIADELGPSPNKSVGPIAGIVVVPFFESLIVLWFMRIGRAIWRPGAPEIWTAAVLMTALHFDTRVTAISGHMLFFGVTAFVVQELFRRGETFWKVVGWIFIPHALWNSMAVMVHSWDV